MFPKTNYVRYITSYSLKINQVNLDLTIDQPNMVNLWFNPSKNPPGREGGGGCLFPGGFKLLYENCRHDYYISTSA